MFMKFLRISAFFYQSSELIVASSFICSNAICFVLEPFRFLYTVIISNKSSSYESQPSDYDGYICNKDTGIIHLPTCTTLPEVKKEMDKVFQEFMVLSGIDPATMMLKSNEQFFRTLTSG